MNRSAIGAILATALLGLAKRKGSGYTNSNFIRCNGYSSSNSGVRIFLKEKPSEDIKELVVDPGSMWTQPYSLPAIGLFRIGVDISGIEDYPEEDLKAIEAAREAEKTYYFEENELLDDDDPDKYNWTDSDDVPDYFIEDIMEEYAEKIKETYFEELMTVESECGSALSEEIFEDISWSSLAFENEYFEKSLSVLGDEKVYIIVETADTASVDYNESVEGILVIYMYTTNIPFIMLFAEDLFNYLQELEDKFDFRSGSNDFSLNKFEIATDKLAKLNQPQLRKR